MKFELEPYKRREPKNTREAPDEELIADVVRVAKLLKKNSVTKQEYDQHGKYSTHALHNRFGGWFSVLGLARLHATRSLLNIPKEELVHDLICVSQTLGKNSVTREEYRRHGKYSTSTISSRLGSWFKALEAAGLEKTRVFGVTDEEYFKNIEEVWIKLGRQPRYAEIEKPLSKYSAEHTTIDLVHGESLWRLSWHT